MRRAAGPRASLVLALALGGCATGGGPRAERAAVVAAGLAADVVAVIDASGLSGAQWGILAVDLATGDTVLGLDAAVRAIPASTQKIATTVAAMDLLGPDHRWRTELWAAGPVDPATGTLAGDLVLPGTGDPTLSPRWWPGGGPAALAALADSLRAAGVRSVTGALVVDASAWDSTSVPASWMVEDLPYRYAATGGAFAIEEGETRVAVRGGAAVGAPVGAAWWPVGEEGFVEALLATGGDQPDVAAAYLPETRRLRLSGTVPVGLADTLSFATRDPVRQAAAALHRALVGAGIEVAGGWRVVWEPGEAPAPATRLAGLASPPLVEVVEPLLEASQNWIAEQLLRGLGVLEDGRAGWSEGGAAVARHAAGSAGVDPLDLRMVDGSGLSVQNLATPRALVALLRHAHARPWGPAYRRALAEPGEAGSTLSDRLAGLEGRAFAKTGSFTNVGALAGYLETADGRELAFAILVNAANAPGARVRDAIDGVVRRLAAGPGVTPPGASSGRAP